MSKAKLISIFFIVVLIILAIYLYVASQPNKLSENSKSSEIETIEPPKPLIEDTEKHLTEYNEWNQQSQLERKKTDTTSTKYKEKEKAHYSRLIELSKFEIHDIEFHGKIIDQYGSPVAGVQVHYIGNRSVSAAGSGEGRLFTDENGAFVINTKGKALVIHEMKKLGYELPKRQRFSNSGGHQTDLSWRSFTSANPYIVNAWKVESYPDIKKGKPFLGFTPDGRDYTIDFLSKNKTKNEGVTEGDLRIRFKRDEENWELEITAANGGLQETEDEYLNLAPENGYASSLIYAGKKHEARKIRKNIYFSSRSGQLYGRVKLEIWPYYRDRLAIEFDYVVNLEEGRNLSVKE